MDILTKKNGLAFAASLLLVAVPPSALAQARGLSPTDLVTLDRASSPLLTSDGKSVIYLLREADLDANKATTGLWTMPADGGEARRLSWDDSSVSSPSLSADGSRVFFLSSKSGSNQLWSVALDDGDPQQVSDFPLDIGSYRPSPDGERVAVTFDVFTDCDNLACTRERLDQREASKRSGQQFDQLFVRHWDSWKDGRRSQLFVAELGRNGKTRGEPRRVSVDIDGDIPAKPFGGSEDYAFAPDGDSLVFAARVAGRSEPWSTNFDLYHVPVDASLAPRNLTEDNPAWDAGPVFSDDGSILYYRAMKRPGFEADRYAIMALELATGKRREIAPDWDRSAGSITPTADGKSLLVDAYDTGTHPLFEIEIDSGEVRKLVSGGNVSAFDVGDGKLLFSRDTLASPAQLFITDLNGNKPRQLTRFNADKLADVRFGEFEQFSFDGWRDETVHGYVVKPWSHRRGQKHPVAFIIHGGPQGSMGDSFHYRWNPQTYAAMGFAVVFIDFHGSAGYGQTFLDSISGDWGGKPLEDLQKGWAAALARYDYLDGDRACALGASYGGYMVNWIAGNWNDAWRCLVSHAGVFDNRMMGYSTEELWFTEWEHGGTPWAVPQNYERHNPVNHVGDWEVPMLVIHGQLDYRIPVEQSLAAFTALQRQDIPSQLLYFPDENHWILKPQNSVQWHEAVGAWLQRWTGPRDAAEAGTSD